MHWLHLSIAIAAEIVATSALKSTNGFTRLIPSVIVIIGYCTAFYFLALALKTMSIGIAYAVWCGIGIIFVSIIAYLLHKQHLDTPAIAGITLIVAGVLVINLFSNSVAH